MLKDKNGTSLYPADVIAYERDGRFCGWIWLRPGNYAELTQEEAAKWLLVGSIPLDVEMDDDMVGRFARVGWENRHGREVDA